MPGSLRSNLRRVPLRYLCFWMILLASLLSGSAQAGGKMKVPLTPERMEACRRLLERDGQPLPAGAVITGITISVHDWTCKNCRHQVNGVPASFPQEAAKCDHCGSPMEPRWGEEYGPATAGSAHLNDAQINAALKMGKDWVCQSCGNGGNRDWHRGRPATECQNCGAPRHQQQSPSSTQSSRGDLAEGSNSVESPDTAGTPPTESPFFAETTSPVGAPDETYRAAPQGEPLADSSSGYRTPTFEIPLPPSSESSSESSLNTRIREGISRHRGPLLGTAGGIAAVGLFAAITLGDTTPQAQILQARWIQTARVEDYQPVLERAPRSRIQVSEPRMPDDPRGPSPGATLIDCHRPSPRQEEMCTYQTYRWIEIDSKVQRGNWDQALPPSDGSWAGLSVPRGARLITTTRFDVNLTLSINGELIQGEWRPHSLEEFQRFRPGTTVRVQVDSLRRIRAVSHQEP